MGLIKTKEEIETMKVSGKITANALKKVLENVKPGAKLIDLDNIAQESIRSQGGKPSFKTVDDYQWTICTTVNDQVVHGIPTQRVLSDGDILGIDIGSIYNGYHSDLATSVPVGKIDRDAEEFLETGRETLEKAIPLAKEGNTIGDISAVIQNGIEGKGYSIVKNLTGHGVGTELHEEPMIPGFGKSGKGSKIKNGMVLAIEVIYAKGSGEVIIEDDNWTISTKDGSLGGLFEKTVAVTKSGPIVLTPYL